MSALRMTLAVYDQIRAHGEQTYPDECCGVLLGCASAEGWRVEGAMAATNARTDSAHNRYQIAAPELINIGREARRRGLDIAGFYHSHPDHAAHWSATDFAEAHWLGCCYVITSVERGTATVTNSFRLGGDSEEEKHFEQETVLVDG